jgi:acyl-coenzyme A thioesterase PaaI-like protein
VTDPQWARERMFISDIGFFHRATGDDVQGEMLVQPHLCVPGTTIVRPSVLATVADVVLGVLASQATAPRVGLTADLTVHSLATVDTDTLTMIGRVLKAGRTLVIGEVWFSAAGHEQPVALSELTFMASPRPQDVIPLPPTEREFSDGHFDRPFADALGARVLAPGVVEMDRDPYVLQPAGTIQGGAVALVAELAAETLSGRAVDDLQVRFLSAVRAGPARASARSLTAGTVRVEVRDAGNHDRLTAVAVVRLGPVLPPA